MTRISGPELVKAVHSGTIWKIWIFAMLGGSALFGLIVLGFSKWLHVAGTARHPVIVTETYAVLSLPAVLLAGSLASFLFAELMSTNEEVMPDGDRG